MSEKIKSKVEKFFCQQLQREIYRICLGDVIRSSESKINELGVSQNPEEPTGSIGFLDGVLRRQNVPILRKGIRYMDPRDVFAILSIGIEPKYRGKKNADILLKRAEELATEFDREAIVTDSILLRAKQLYERNGYYLYNDERSAVKFLG